MISWNQPVQPIIQGVYQEIKNCVNKALTSFKELTAHKSVILVLTSPLQLIRFHRKDIEDV